MENKHLKHLPSLFHPAKLLLPVLLSFLVLFTGREDKADSPKSEGKPTLNRQIPTSLYPISAHDAPAAPTPASTVKKQEKIAAVPRKTKYLAGEDPDFARQCGWPVTYPLPLTGSILPEKRIVAYYGNPLSKRMGVLGQYSKEEMLRRLKSEVDLWQKADPSHPVQPALHLIAVVDQEKAGKAGKYRLVMPDSIINKVYGWANEANAIMFIDIQTGHDDIRDLLPRFEWILKNANVHLAIDPEFYLNKSMKHPGSKIGTCDAVEINFASAFLQKIVKKYNIPPKVLVVHRFTRKMVTNADQIKLNPEVVVVMNMDGWGAPWLKRATYKDYIVEEPVQFTGFKLFYHNDTKRGDPLLTPQALLRLNPIPLYIQYQ